MKQSENVKRVSMLLQNTQKNNTQSSNQRELNICGAHKQKDFSIQSKHILPISLENFLFKNNTLNPLYEHIQQHYLFTSYASS
jgi:hypothetical protein